MTVRQAQDNYEAAVINHKRAEESRDELKVKFARAESAVRDALTQLQSAVNDLNATIRGEKRS